MAKNNIIKTDICIIGGGSGGLSLAAGAVQMGARVVLVEANKMGGDCLNYGCVPSKALLAAAAAATPPAPEFGVSVESKIDFAATMEHVQGVIDSIAPHDSVERFEGLGVQVIEAEGRFISPRAVSAGQYEVRAKRFVIATGSAPSIPPIAGLADTPYFTNETLFANKTQPEHLIIIGAGPIGAEMAQAFVRLGSKITMIAADDFLAREDAALASELKTYLLGEGIEMHLNSQIKRVQKTETGVEVQLADKNINGSHLLVAAGRKPNCDNLGLVEAGIEIAGAPHYIKTDARLRTSNRRVFAIGDVSGVENAAPQFTHAANYHAGIVIRNILFRLPAKIDYTALPRATYTSPELAHVGLSEEQARREGKLVQTLTREFAENDRARAERDTKGQIKLVLGKGGRLLGVSILGRGAGDLLGVWTLALQRKLSLGAMAGVIAPYPTRGEANKHIAGAYFTPSIFSARMRRIVRFLLFFMR